jgi:subtilisin family serine protease
MASPHVAGAAALYKSTHPADTPAQVRTALINAGTLDWSNVGDPDGTKERLLNVDTF